MKPVIFNKDNSSIVLMPSESKTTITYAVNFNHPDLRNRWVNLDQDKNTMEIVEARTFGYLKDLERFQAAGYSKGVTIENTVGLTDDGYTTTLRSEFEPAKHKILDIIGDLYLTGYNPLDLNANIIVKEAGHGYHSQVAKILKQTLEK
jgi:UDP-3-O-[3-hydroxymyristoyl] N-acetylglucosamine deacetylase